MGLFDGFQFPFTEESKAKVDNDDLQLTITQRKTLYERLKRAGLTIKKDFGGSLKRAWVWFNKTK